ncbi:MAG: S1 RNA-binding domain-containing protein, partial [Gammaproteobacteria bacterium]|nr:S1 RNA-binding domain-containing protein [Gammaproteobacteria bacterium]
MDTKSGIPLDKRLLKGRVSSIDAGALHLLLPDAFRYADRARVSIEDLPKGRTLDSYRRLNDSLPVFLLAPSAKDPRLWYASIRWAESEEANPWFARPVSLKDTVHGTAKNYVENYAVIVRLDNGMDAFLHINELPAGHNHGSIADHVHIGDRIGGLVERIDERRLQINISIPPLLKRKREEEEQRREQLPFPDEDQPEAVTYTEPPLPSLPSDTYVLIIDNDRFFALAVKDWLEANGVKVNYTSKPQAVKTHLQQGRITHVLLDYHLDDTKSEKEIQNALKGKELRVAIASGDWKAAQKDAAKHRWAFLPKPLNSALLHCWLSGNPLPAEPLPADDQKSSLLWRGTRQEQ